MRDRKILSDGGGLSQFIWAVHPDPFTLGAFRPQYSQFSLGGDMCLSSCFLRCVPNYVAHLCHAMFQAGDDFEQALLKSDTLLPLGTTCELTFCFLQLISNTPIFSQTV